MNGLIQIIVEHDEGVDVPFACAHVWRVLDLSLELLCGSYVFPGCLLRREIPVIPSFQFIGHPKRIVFGGSAKENTSVSKLTDMLLTLRVIKYTTNGD